MSNQPSNDADGPQGITAGDLAEAAALGGENAVMTFSAGIHEVYDAVEEDILPDSAKQANPTGPVARFERLSDRGDADVGMPGIDMWILAKDQSGTALQQLLVANSEMAEALAELCDWVSAKCGPGEMWPRVLVEQMVGSHARDAYEQRRSDARGDVQGAPQEDAPAYPRDGALRCG